MGIIAVEVIEELKQKLSHVEDEIGQIRSRILEMERVEWGDVSLLIKEAEQMRWVRQGWTREMIVEEGNRLMEECRSYAVAKGIAVDEEGEATIGD